MTGEREPTYLREPMTLEGRDLGSFEWENIYLKE